MPRSKLLDKGEELVTVYPEVEYTTSRGNKMQVPGTEGTNLRVTVSAERMSSSDLLGQVSISIVTCSTRWIPGWDWARVVFRGEEWDLVTPPHVASGASRASRHFEFQLRSRNKLDNKVAHGEVAGLD